MSRSPFPNHLDLRLVPATGLWRLLSPFAYATRDGWTVLVPEGFETNGASIPRFFWRVIGSPMDARFVRAAVVHDWLWQKAVEGRLSFAEANRLFREALAESGVSPWRRWLMWAAVAANAARLRLLFGNRKRGR